MDYQGVFEGKLLWSGHRITDFTIRELANMAYYHHVSQLQPGGEDDPTVEEQIEAFEERIGQCVSASTRAEEMLRQSLILRGVDPDAKPELSPELAAKLENDALYSDKDFFFSEDHGKEQRGKKIKGDKDFE